MKAGIGQKTIVLLLTILLLIVFPIIFILSVPLLIFRFIVSKLATFLRPKLGQMVTNRDCIFAAEDYTKVSASTVLSAIVLEGQVDLEKATDCAEKRLLSARFPNGKIKYPELKQYITTWANYYFWKEDTNFDIKNHIKIHQVQKQMTDHDLQELKENMLQEPWAEKRSTWDITFVPNCYPAGLKSSGPHTVLIVRFHHILGDAYSWIPLIVQELCKTEMKFPQQNERKRSFPENILDQITFPIRAAYDYAYVLSIGFQKNVPFGIKEGMSLGKYNMAVSDILSLKKMKEIKEHFNVCFSSVVSAALSGAIRDLLISKQMEIPNVLQILAPPPLPGNFLKLSNYFTLSVLEYPIGEDDAVKRLKYCDVNYKNIKNSTQQRFFDYCWLLMGSYPSSMIKSAGQRSAVNVETLNLPGPPTDAVDFNGHKCIDFWVTSGYQPEALGLGFCGLNFADGFRISSCADTCVLSKHEVRKLSASIVRHVDILHEQINE